MKGLALLLLLSSFLPCRCSFDLILSCQGSLLWCQDIIRIHCLVIVVIFSKNPDSFPYFIKCRPLLRMISFTYFLWNKTKKSNEQQIQANKTIHVVAPLLSLNLWIEQSTPILVRDWEFSECSWLKLSAIYRTNFFFNRSYGVIFLNLFRFLLFFSSDVIPSTYYTNASWL